MITRKEKTITIALMVVLGTCMHFVHECIPSGILSSILGNIFPVNETCWEHMKMIWYPFLVAGIIFSFKKQNRGYFTAFIVCPIMAMLLQIGGFVIYQSFTGTSMLVLDIILYVFSMGFCILLAFDFAEKKWTQKMLPLWILLAAVITACFVYLTYNPGTGYVFYDSKALIAMGM